MNLIKIIVSVIALTGVPAWTEGVSFSAADGSVGINILTEKNHQKPAPIMLGDRKAVPLLVQDPAGEQVYFEIKDDTFKDGGHPSVVFTVDYYDKGTGTIDLEYDSLEEVPMPGAFKKAGTITLGDTKAWKTATFIVTDARFDGRCNNADFRINLGKNTEFNLGAVRVTPGTAPPSVVWRQAPRGKIIEGTFDQSRIYPGTTRKYTVYVPQEYDPATPACVYVGQDGFNPKFTSAMNRLIFDKKIPVTIGLFIQSGSLVPSSKDQAKRANRCYEYDSLGDTYARFLLDEFIPYIAKTYNLNLSNNGNDRCIGGGSSGGICAFNVAWERPDAFRRVYSISGSFAALRGGDIFPSLVRKYDPKPLRIFLHVGSNDLADTGASWWLANQEMDQALKFSGYDYQFRTSDGHHMDKYTEIFPEAMTWLWRDWPAPIAVGAGSPFLQNIWAKDESWRMVGEGYGNIHGLATNPKGEVIFCDTSANKLYRIGTNEKVSPFLADAQQVCGLTTDATGNLFGVSEATGNVVSFKANEAAKVVAGGISGNALTVTRNGGFYVTSRGPAGAGASKVWHISPKGEKKVVDTGLQGATGVAISADDWLLNVADGASHWVYSYQINDDGSLANREPLHWLLSPDSADSSGADGIAIDQKGLLYVATARGIQIEDLQGHNRCILAAPYGKVTGVAFGGPDFDVLYAACGDKIFAHKMKVPGENIFQPPIKAINGGADLAPPVTAH